MSTPISDMSMSCYESREVGVRVLLSASSLSLGCMCKRFSDLPLFRVMQNEY